MFSFTHSISNRFLKSIHHQSNRKWVTLSSTLLPSSDAASKTTSGGVSDAIPSLSDFDLPTNSNNKNLLCIRHSTAHIMAMAVQKLFPQARTAIGPWTDNGYAFVYLLTIYTIAIDLIY